MDRFTRTSAEIKDTKDGVFMCSSAENERTNTWQGKGNTRVNNGYLLSKEENRVRQLRGEEVLMCPILSFVILTIYSAHLSRQLNGRECISYLLSIDDDE